MKTPFVFAGLGIVLTAAVGFGLHSRHSRHTEEAQRAIPEHVILAQGNVASTPDGIKVRLIGISKAGDEDPERWWAPNGGILTEKPRWFGQGFPIPPQGEDGKVRVLRFELSTTEFPTQISTSGRLPGKVDNGMTREERLAHGWFYEQTFQVNRYGLMHQEAVVADDPSEHRYLFGVASGEWKTVDTAKSELAGPPYLDRVMAKGNWGTATVTQSMFEGHRTRLSAAGPGEFSSKSPSGMTITIKPSPEYADDQMRIQPYDSGGEPIPAFCLHNQMTISYMGAKKIASFEVQIRPYVFIEFDGIQFDPDAKAWKDVVTGTKQATQKVVLGDVTAELEALNLTRPGTEDWNREQYVGGSVYSPDGRLWIDHPQEYDNAVGPMFLPGAPPNNQKRLPPPWIAFIRIGPPGIGAQGQFDVYGSNSAVPGEDLHANWNLEPKVQSSSPEPFVDLRDRWWATFALAPQAQYAQIQMRIVSGSWEPVVEVKPDPQDIKPTGQGGRIYSLAVGPEVRVRFNGSDGKPVDKLCGRTDPDHQQQRVFARLKSGVKMPIQAMVLEHVGGSPNMISRFDFDREATATEGDVIALSDVDAFVVEARTIKTGYLVIKVPKVQ